MSCSGFFYAPVVNRGPDDVGRVVFNRIGAVLSCWTGCILHSAHSGSGLAADRVQTEWQNSSGWLSRSVSGGGRMRWKLTNSSRPPQSGHFGPSSIPGRGVALVACNQCRGATRGRCDPVRYLLRLRRTGCKQPVSPGEMFSFWSFRSVNVECGSDEDRE
jgi:hypothetical protein